MRNDIPEAELLKVAFDDELFRQELQARSGKDWPQLLAALKTGTTHPKAQHALAWIDQLVSESCETIATLRAAQDFGAYGIEVYGFDQLCRVWAPDFGETGPFLSHDDAISFAQDEWSEFLTGDGVARERFPKSRAADRAEAAKAKREAKKVPLPRYRLNDLDYSKIGVNTYRPYPRQWGQSCTPLTGNQLAETLIKDIGDLPQSLRQQLQATGWESLIAKVERVAKRKKKRFQAQEAREEARFTKAVVKFFDRFLAGRDGSDDKLLDAAAREWVWRDFDLDENHPHYEDRVGAIQRYARQLHYQALNAYVAAKWDKRPTAR